MSLDDFLLAEYSTMREESRHNDDLRFEMIRFFIGLVTALFGFLWAAPSIVQGVSFWKWLEVALPVLIMLIGWGVLAFHAIERAKNKENEAWFIPDQKHLYN